MSGLPINYLTRQGASSATFTPPPLDGTLFLPEIIDWHIARSPNHPFTVLVPSPTSPHQDPITITWSEVGQATHHLASRILSLLPGPDGPSDPSRPGRPRTVGILANMDSLTYCTTILGCMRAGLEVFPLSPNNSIPALQHLLKTTSVSLLIGSLPPPTSPGTSLQHLTQSVLADLPSIQLLPIPSFKTLYPRLTHTPIPRLTHTPIPPYTPTPPPPLPPLRSLPSFLAPTPPHPSLLVHSSGSTSLPHPIPYPQHFMLSYLSTFYYTSLDTCGTLWAAMALPMVHVIGMLLVMIAPMGSGLTSAVFFPAEPPTLPTPETVLAAMKRARVEYILSVPSFYEAWSTSPDDTKYLSTFKGVAIGGGPLPIEAGNRLVTNGVKLFTMYGASETARLAKLFSSLGGLDWPYFSLTPELETQLIPEEEGVYRLIAVESPGHPLAVWNVPGQKAYDTGDLLREHAVHKGYYRLVGRADDQITMLNGEKTNPGPMEGIIRGNPLVAATVMFGRARSQVGLAIEPVTPLDTSNDAELEAFRNAIWPDVERANELAPTHSRIFKELILVVDPVEKPFPRTIKGTVMRNAVLKKFAAEIDALYEAAQGPADAEWAKPPATGDESDIRAFVERVVNGVMQHGPRKDVSINPDRDLFEQGCDSLQSTYIRTAIMHAMRQLPTPLDPAASARLDRIQQSLVYMYPTITQLSRFLFGLLQVTEAEDGQPADIKEQVTKMVEKYSNEFPIHRPRVGAGEAAAAGQSVLLTGSTGRLGTYLLRRLLLDDSVMQVYAINRRSQSETILQRQTAAFTTCGVDLKLLDSNKLRLIDVDPASGYLGLEPPVLEEIQSSATVFIHNAWPVNFNLSLQSFESAIQGLRQLIDLALSSPRAHPPEIIFTSSIASVSGWNKQSSVPEEAIPIDSVTISTGYGASKFVAERLLQLAGSERGLPATIWRIGQLAGSTLNGAWSTSEWVPILVKGGQQLGAMPTFEGGVVSWVPVDKAADAIGESVANSQHVSRYLHLIHPRPVAWNTIFKVISSEISVPLVPYKEWYSLLQAAEQSDAQISERNLALKLVDFFRGVQVRHDKQGQYEALGLPPLELGKSTRISRTLAELEPLTSSHVAAWLEFWRSRGLLDGIAK